jgi:hypothetical protein
VYGRIPETTVVLFAVNVCSSEKSLHWGLVYKNVTTGLLWFVRVAHMLDCVGRKVGGEIWGCGDKIRDAKNGCGIP